MKKARLITIALLLTLSLSSAVLAGCAGCGTTNDNNANDMVESTPAQTEEGILETETAFEDNAVSENTIVEDNANLTDANGNPVMVPENNADESGNIAGDAGNMIVDAGDVIGGAAENVGEAAKDVVDGVGNVVKSLVE